MTRRIEVFATYEGDADAIFTSALDFAELQAAMRGLATYKGLPDGPIAEGDTVTVDVTIWGIIGQKGYRMHVERLDHANRIVQSRENGDGIRRWDHTLSVQPDGDRVLWTDSILVDAGWRTRFMARFGKYLYARRHRRRNALRIESRITRV